MQPSELEQVTPEWTEIRTDDHPGRRYLVLRVEAREDTTILHCRDKANDAYYSFYAEECTITRRKGPK